MHFNTKSILKNNRNYTPKLTLRRASIIHVRDGKQIKKNNKKIVTIQ